MPNLRFAIRQLTKTPTFTIMAVLLLALGVGVNTALFSVFKLQALTPLPFPHPEALTQLWWRETGTTGQMPFSGPDFRDLQPRLQSWETLGGFTSKRVNLGGDHPESALTVVCTPGALAAYGIAPQLGRLLTDGDNAPGAPPVVVLSYALWQQTFSGDPDVLQRTLMIDGREHAVVGVMPADFEFIAAWVSPRTIRAWLPLSFEENSQNRGSHWLAVQGRLKPGVSRAAAAAEYQAAAMALAAEYPDSHRRLETYVIGTQEFILHHARDGYTLVLAGVALVLLVAAANVAILLLARGASRQGEYALRAALGATRRDLLGLALTESLALAACGVLAGLLLASWSIDLLNQQVLAKSGRLVMAHLDPAAFGFAVLVGVGATVLAALPAALAGTRVELNPVLKEDSNASVGSRTRLRFLRHLIALQVALAFVLTNTALLLFASYRSIIADNVVLDSAQTLTGEIWLNGQRYADAAARTRFWNELIARTRALPGVTAAGVTSKLPLEGGNNAGVLVGDQAFNPDIHRPWAELSTVSRGYFAAAGIALRAGRDLEPADMNPKEIGVVVNQRLVALLPPGTNPIGQRVQGNSSPTWFTGRIVGVVADVRQWGPTTPAQPEIYFPLESEIEPRGFLTVRTTGDHAPLAPALRRVLADLDPDLSFARLQTIRDVLDSRTSFQHTLMQLLNLFMLLTLTMTGIGVFGTLTYHVLRRQREIGVRLALGAGRRSIFALVFGEALPSALLGAGAGLILSGLVAFASRTVVADVSLWNPLFYLGTLGIVSGTFVIACLFPAARAARIDPIAALRSD